MQLKRAHNVIFDIQKNRHNLAGFFVKRQLSNRHKADAFY